MFSTEPYLANHTNYCHSAHVVTNKRDIAQTLGLTRAFVLYHAIRLTIRNVHDPVNTCHLPIVARCRRTLEGPSRLTVVLSCVRPGPPAFPPWSVQRPSQVPEGGPIGAAVQVSPLPRVPQPGVGGPRREGGACWRGASSRMRRYSSLALSPSLALSQHRTTD